MLYQIRHFVKSVILVGYLFCGRYDLIGKFGGIQNPQKCLTIRNVTHPNGAQFLVAKQEDIRVELRNGLTPDLSSANRVLYEIGSQYWLFLLELNREPRVIIVSQQGIVCVTNGILFKIDGSEDLAFLFDDNKFDFSGLNSFVRTFGSLTACTSGPNDALVPGLKLINHPEMAIPNRIFTKKPVFNSDLLKQVLNDMLPNRTNYEEQEIQRAFKGISRDCLQPFWATIMNLVKRREVQNFQLA